MIQELVTRIRTPGVPAQVCATVISRSTRRCSQTACTSIGGNRTIARDLQCFLNEQKKLISSKDIGRNTECAVAVGAVCQEGYMGTGGSACSECCKAQQQGCTESYYMDVSENVCSKCPSTNGALLFAGTAVAGILSGLSQGGLAPLAFSTVNPLSMAFLYVCAGLNIPKRRCPARAGSHHLHSSFPKL